MEFLWYEGREKTKPNKANLYFAAENAELGGVKGDMCKWLPNKEIQSTSSFSAVLANPAVDEKQSQFAVGGAQLDRNKRFTSIRGFSGRGCSRVDCLWGRMGVCNYGICRYRLHIRGS